MAATTRIGTTFIVLSQLLDRLVPGNYRGRNAIKDELVRLVQWGEQILGLVLISTVDRWLEDSHHWF
ncbi:MAG: hypothetical protein HC899_37275 [Leptolyngbyaceae cyanobacterium SM1_4_3]|nr:hypothetical protein [Leptolyngbyaceae cyanobacterium SM1_4_3]